MLIVGYFFAHHHLCTSVNDDNLVKLGRLHGGSDHFALSVAVHLSLGFFEKLLDVRISIFQFGVLEFHNIRVGHVAIDVEQRT